MNEGRRLLSRVLAVAIKQAFKGSLLGAGGTTNSGFYYDAELPQKLEQTDLWRLETAMRELLGGEALSQHRTDRATLRQRLVSLGERYRVEVLDGLPAEQEEVPVVEASEYLDFADTPLPSDCDLVFKLQKLSGAYWMGDETRPMLTRITGIAFESSESLVAYKKNKEALAARDHRQLGRRLGLFTIMDDVGKGLPMLLPRGAAIRHELERFIIDEEMARGYELVYTPALGRRELFETSGHLAQYGESMYPPIALEHQEYILRPMTCPHHFMLYKSSPRSYRELPIRYTEISSLYRRERSGELYGLIRILNFHLADSHIMCRPDQVEGEFLEVLDLVHFVMHTLGLAEDCTYRASLRDPNDEKFEGDFWEEAERLLLSAADKAGLEYTSAPGEAVFYGPKLDVQMRNINGKEETVFTIQIDMVLPQRFDMDYKDAGEKICRPVVIHRSSVGCIERTIAFLVEKYGGSLPFWLAPVQMRLIPISDAVSTYASQTMATLRRSRLRVDVDLRSESLGRRIRTAREELVPYIGVVGPKEESRGTVSVTNRDTGAQTEIDLEQLAKQLSRERDERALELAL
jgi:threonyl-tRNA synthetase